MGNRGHKLSKAHRRAQRYNIGMLDNLRVMASWAVQDTGDAHAKDIRTASIGAGTYGPSTGDTARDVVAWYAQPPAPCTCTGDSRARCTAWHTDTTRPACAHTTHDHAGTCGPQCNGTPCTCTQVKGTGRALWLPQGT